MKRTRIFYSVALVGLLLAGGLPSLFSQPRTNDPLSQTVRLKLDHVNTPDAVTQVLLDADLPGGISVVNYCGGYATRDLRPSQNSVRGVLNAVVSTDPNYLWRVNEGVVNLSPRYTKNHFLETVIPKLELENVKTPDEALQALLAIPEVDRQATHELGSRVAEGYAYGFSVNGPAVSERQSSFSLALKDVTVRDALNSIAKSSGGGIWVLVKNECTNGNRKTYSLKFVHK